MMSLNILTIIVLITTVVGTKGCIVGIDEMENKQKAFLQMIDDDIRFIYFDLKIPIMKDTQNISVIHEMNETYKNGLLRWIWSKEEVSFLLSYPDAFPALTFNLLDGEFTKHLDLELNFSGSDCNYSYAYYSNSFNVLLYQNFFENQTDWMMCHRTFENQDWKNKTNILLSYWIGYYYECFSSNCEYGYSQCTKIVPKSTIDYVILVFLLLTGLYFPLVFFLFPERINSDTVKERIENYQKMESPYSFSRLFLHSSYGYKHHEKSSGEFFKLFNACLPELRLFMFLSIVLCLFQTAKISLVRHYIVDYSEFQSIYGYIGELHIPFFGNAGIEYVWLLISLVFFFSVCVALYIHFFLTYDNNYFIPVVFCKGFDNSSYFYFIRIDNKCLESGKKNVHYGYTAFAHEFLKRIEILFTLKFYLSLLCPINADNTGGKCFRPFQKCFVFIAVLLMGILNIVSCLFPIIYFLISPIKKFKHLCSCTNGRCLKALLYSFATCMICFTGIYLLIFLCGAVDSVLSFILQVIIFNIFVVVPMYDFSFKFWAIAIATIYYLLTFYQAFVDVYKELLIKSYEIREQNESDPKDISTETFDLIADQIYPLRIQIVLLVGKILLFVVFLYALIDVTIVRGYGTDAFFEQHLPLIIGVMIPAVALKMYGGGPEQHIEKHSNTIKKILEVNKGNSHECRKMINVDCNLLDIWLQGFKANNWGIKFCAFLSTIPVCIVFVISALFTVIFPFLCHTCNPSCRCSLTKDDIEAKSATNNDHENLTQPINEPLRRGYESLPSVDTLVG